MRLLRQYQGARGLWVLALLLGTAACGFPSAGTRAADLELKQDRSLESRARELFSRQRGRINGARVIESTPERLVLRVVYSGLNSEGLYLSARALDRDREPLLDIASSEVPLRDREGEAEVRIGYYRRGDQEPLDQRFVLVQIGSRSEGKTHRHCSATFECARQWGGTGGTFGVGGAGGPGFGGGGGVLNLTAQPVGRSSTLGAQPPLRPFLTAPAPLKSVLTSDNPGSARKGGVMVRMAQPGAARLPAAVGATAFRPVGRPITGIRPLPPSVIVGLPGDVSQQQGKGPGTSGLSLSGIASDVDVTPDDFLSLYPMIFEDANPESGFFYYLPRGFHLEWSEESGYAFRILYGASATDANPNTVYISARLTAGINSADLALAEKLARQYFQANHPTRQFKALQPFPISGMKPELSAEAYNIGKDKLVVTSTMDLSGTIDLSFTTDPVTKENLQAVLTQGLGLNGTVTLQSASTAGTGSLEAQVPLTIRLADRDSFGGSAFTRGVAFRNPSPYPAKLKYLHVLMPESPARVYSYSLGDRLVPAGGSAQIDASQVRSWLDTAALKEWVDYSVAGDDSTNKAVMDKITGGVTNVAQAEITFRTLTPLADTMSSLILVTISSRYLEPKGQMEKVATLELTKDNEAFKLKPVFLVGRQADEEKPDDPLFRYRLTIVKADGTTKEGKEWVASSKSTIFIGSAQIKPILEAN